MCPWLLTECGSVVAGQARLADAALRTCPGAAETWLVEIVERRSSE